MNLYKRGNLWWVAFTLNKHRYRLSTKQKTKLMATEVANALYNRYKDVVIHKKVSFKQIVDKYFTLNHYNNLAKDTKKNFQTQLKKALDYFKTRDIFDTKNLYAYIEYLITEAKLSQSTARSKDFTMLSTILNEVKKTGLIEINPFKELDLSSYKKTNNKERFLLLEERELIKKYCLSNNKLPLLDYINFAIETGLRKKEQLNLSWDRIEFIKKEIYIIKTKTNVNRMIPITPLALDILKKLKNLGLKKPFHLPEGTIDAQWIKLRKDLELNKGKTRNSKDILTWHSLRHTFASWSVMGLHSWQNNKPMPLLDLSKWLGHKDIKMTMRYAHLQIENLHKLIDK